ncbi:pentatricopeptide repeat-containing protein At5g56310-like [Andrographis paniculata]|uniref:pentatricopeptide repeat-containing protein At5g56310-like n=1 Tax=Andrographis paniculata TaxID=175694 RepID=UPI0021E90E48|nr:pentatricopeptide repeat-containing protein At5g56310-like [Andrographis paniculata]
MLISRRAFQLSLRRTTATAAIEAPLSVSADKCKSMDQIRQIHAQMIVTARIHDAYAASRLINFCALSDLNYALKLFHHIPTPNLFMWNTIIRALANTSNPSDGFLLYVEMRRRGVAPGTHTFPFVLKACSNMKLSKCFAQVHANVLKFGFEIDPHVGNALVRGISVTSGSVGDARKVFDEMPVKDLRLWTTMICGYAQNGCPKEAITLFQEMIGEGFEPRGVVLSSVLSACAQSAQPELELGERIHRYIEEKGMEVGVILGTAIVNMYARNGALAKAKKYFDGMKAKNVATWNALICGMAVHGRAEEAINVFKMMLEEGFEPNGITLLGVMSACCHAGLVDYGREVFYSMFGVYGVKANLKHYGCAVDLLGRGGRVLEAEEVIRTMPWKADVAIWGALLSGCRECGNIEVAERAAREILDLDPQNHGVHVVLSNMYVEAGKWEQAMKERKGMRDGSSKKMAGWSVVGGGTRDRLIEQVCDATSKATQQY